MSYSGFGSVTRSRIVGSTVSVAFVLSMAGCGIGPAPSPQLVGGQAISGHLHGGQQPVMGSNIALFAASSSGYGSSVTPVAVTTTDSSGDFNISTSYSCTTGQQMYIVAAGGNPGLGGGTDNSGIFLVAALGACPVTSAVVNIDEVTTVAAAYALSGFLPSGGAGLTEANVKLDAAMAGVATSGTNVQGLTDAFNNAGNIVNIATGLAYTATPAAGSNGVVPQATIHALADILQPCVNSAAATGSSSNCPALFAAATPPSGTGIAAPVNVFQAALDIAQYPGNNVATLFSQINALAAFPTSLTAAPNDWSIGVAYTNPTLVSASGMGIDAKDNVYVTGTGYLLEFSPVGVAGGNLVASPVGSTDTLREIAFDKNGNLFITDGIYGGVYEYSPSSSSFTARSYGSAPASNTNTNSYAVAVDQDNDVWTESYSKSSCSTIACSLIEYPSTATSTPSYGAYAPFSTIGGYSTVQPTNATGSARGMAFDVKTGNIWLTTINDNLAQLFTVTPRTTGVATASAAATQLTGLGTEAGTPTSNTGYGTISVAVDSNSKAWIVTAGGPAVTGTKSTAAIAGQITPVSKTGAVGTAVTGGGLAGGGIGSIVIDGSNNLFVGSAGSAGTSAVIAYSPALGAFLSPNIGINPGATYATGALSGGPLYEPTYLEVDKSGALWVLSSGSGSTGKPNNIVQILGVAAPTDPVLADGNYGTKP